jgi:hypothetical protein
MSLADRVKSRTEIWDDASHDTKFAAFEFRGPGLEPSSGRLRHPGDSTIPDPIARILRAPGSFAL